MDQSKLGKFEADREDAVASPDDVLLLVEKEEAKQEELRAQPEDESKEKPIIVAGRAQIRNATIRNHIRNLSSSDARVVNKSLQFLSANKLTIIERLSYDKSDDKYLNLSTVHIKALGRFISLIKENTLEPSAFQQADDAVIKFDKLQAEHLVFAILHNTLPEFLGMSRVMLLRKERGCQALGYENNAALLRGEFAYLGAERASQLLCEPREVLFPADEIAARAVTVVRSAGAFHEASGIAFQAVESDLMKLVLSQKIAEANLDGVFDAISGVDIADMHGFLTTPIRQLHSRVDVAKSMYKAICTYGISLFAEITRAPASERTLPRTLASYHPTLAAEFIRFMLHKNASPQDMRDIAMDRTFKSVRGNSKSILEVFATNCVASEAAKDSFCKFFDVVKPLLMVVEKVDLYCHPHSDHSIISIAAAHNPALFKMILADLTQMVRDGKLGKGQVDKILFTTVSVQDEAAPAHPEEGDRAPLLARHQRMSNIKMKISDLIAQTDSAEAKEFIAAANAIGVTLEPHVAEVSVADTTPKASASRSAAKPVAQGVTQGAKKGESKSTVCNVM